MKDKIRALGALLVLASFVMVGCKTDTPPSIWNPEFQGKPDPVISSIEPPDVAFAGIGEITITGQNFSSNSEENHVYFNGVEGTVLSASATVLVVRVPNSPADSMRIKLRVDGALLFAEYFPYQLATAAEEYGGFDKFEDAYGIACDSDENLYVSLDGRKIKQVTPDGEKQDYAATLVNKASAMKYGPEGYIYYVNVLKYVFRLSPDGTKNELFASVLGGVIDLDFDAFGNLYCGGNGKAVYRVKSDKSSTVAAEYSPITIRTLRVFDGYLYVGGRDNSTNQNAIWRNQILSADELGPKEMYFDWSNQINSFSNVLSIAFAADGDMLVGTDSPEAIIIVHPDGTFEPLYPGVLEPRTYAMTWGNANYLYVNRRSDDAEKRKIIRINMLKPGAPYYGRQ